LEVKKRGEERKRSPGKAGIQRGVRGRWEGKNYGGSEDIRLISVYKREQRLPRNAIEGATNEGVHLGKN